ncbi:MAG: hypothetical protein WAU78_18190 [Roseiarcus sp.]
MYLADARYIQPNVHIYLSPHHDDVCFSIGHLAGRLGGELVNLFTLSRYAPAKVGLPADEESRAEIVSQLRREEDQRFVQIAGLARHDLGLREPPLIGYEPFDLARLDVEVASLSATLVPYLLALLPAESEPGAASLYCPMGIGGHRNHLSTLLAVRGAYDALRRRCVVFLYEDLHYASVASVRKAGLRRAAQVFAGAPLCRIVSPLDSSDAARKMQWIGLYASQHAQAPRLGDFTPASGLVSGLHEIVWEVSPSFDGQAESPRSSRIRRVCSMSSIKALAQRLSGWFSA